jgi:dTMP kinase
MPDRTILLDIPPTEGLHRQQECNRMEQEALDFHTRVRNGFLSEAKLFPLRFCVIDARSDIQAVFHQVLENLKDIL